MEQVLAIKECNGSKFSWGLRHGTYMPQKAKPRQRPFGVSDGGEIYETDMAYLTENCNKKIGIVQQKNSNDPVQPRR